MNNTDLLLMAILECGTLDLSVLNGIEYDFYEIVKDLNANGIKLTLNNITNEIFLMGLSDIHKALDEEIKYCEQMVESEIDTEKYRKELVELLTLEPDEDIEWYCNCLDTSIWYNKNADIYEKYLGKQISDIEDNMGFEIGK